MPRPALIIEDDADIAESVRYNLESAGFKTLVASTGEHGLSLALDTQNPPAVIVLDLMLPGMNGIEICRRLRRENQTRRTPIIMLTAKTSEADRVAGLDVGADDYLGKPFSVNELLARVRALLRRTDEETREHYDDGRLAIDFDDVRASCDGANVKLTHKEFQLLSTLAKKRIASSPDSSCSIKCGVTVTTAMRAPSTCISGACDKNWTPAVTASKLWSE